MAYVDTISLVRVTDGWAVMLTDGRELARFTGPNARVMAVRYVASTNPVRRHLSIDHVRRARQERGGRRMGPSPS